MDRRGRWDGEEKFPKILGIASKVKVLQKTAHKFLESSWNFLYSTNYVCDLHNILLIAPYKLYYNIKLMMIQNILRWPTVMKAKKIKSKINKIFFCSKFLKINLIQNSFNVYTSINHLIFLLFELNVNLDILWI